MTNKNSIFYSGAWCFNGRKKINLRYVENWYISSYCRYLGITIFGIYIHWRCIHHGPKRMDTNDSGDLLTQTPSYLIHFGFPGQKLWNKKTQIIKRANVTCILNIFKSVAKWITLKCNLYFFMCILGKYNSFSIHFNNPNMFSMHFQNYCQQSNKVGGVILDFQGYESKSHRYFLHRLEWHECLMTCSLLPRLGWTWN